MSEFAIEVEGGSSVRLPTAGKYCDRDIVVTATGGGEEVFWAEPNTVVGSQSRILYTRNMLMPHTTAGFIGFSQCPELETIEAPYYTGTIGHSFIFNCAKLKSVKLPRVTKLTDAYFIRQQSVSSVIEEIQLGSIGYPFTQLSNQWNYGNDRAGCTITFYVDATTIAEAQESIANWGSFGGQGTSKVTFVFRNSTTGEVITE